VRSSSEPTLATSCKLRQKQQKYKYSPYIDRLQLFNYRLDSNYSDNMADLNGDWNARKLHCAAGYEAVWRIEMSEGDEKLTITEQKGAKCCFCVPNLFLKSHFMEKSGENTWEGRLGFKKIAITKVSDDELDHLTTDGMMKMTRVK